MKQFEKLFKKQEFLKCEILILTLKELIKIYRLKNIDLCSFVIGYFKKKSFFRKNNKIQSLIKTLSLLKTENAQMFWFKIKGFLDNEAYFDKVLEILKQFSKQEQFTNLMRFFYFYSDQDLI